MAFKVTQEWVDTVVDTAKDMADTLSQVTVDTPSQNTLNQNTPSHQHMVGTPNHPHTADTPSHHQHMVDTPSPQHTVDTPSPPHTVDTPSPQHTVDTPSHHQHTVDTVIMVINQSQRTNHTATITDHPMEVTQDRRMDNLWATMAHLPTAHLPMAHLALPKATMAHHVILKATMVLPNQDRHA